MRGDPAGQYGTERMQDADFDRENSQEPRYKTATEGFAIPKTAK
jgi:hypothetical protein